VGSRLSICVPFADKYGKAVRAENCVRWLGDLIHFYGRSHLSCAASRRSIMKIVVIGGRGLIGAKLVKTLRADGHEVLEASRATGVDTFTGEGLAAALAGAEVVVDVMNAPSWEDKAVLEFFETTGRNILAAEAAASVKHHVALSVVGTEHLLASGYFRAKLA